MSKSLGQIDTNNATHYLINAINDHDSHVRKTAVIALGKICDICAFEPLMKMLEKEEYKDVVDEFIIALLHINAKGFLSRINQFDDYIKAAASNYASDSHTGASC